MRSLSPAPQLESQLLRFSISSDCFFTVSIFSQRNYESKLATSPPKRNTSNRSVNQSPHRSRYTGRLTERDYGKENMAAASKVANDADTYKYFSNSVRDPMDWRHMDVRSQSGHGVDVNVTMESHRCENHTFPMKKNRDTDARNCARCDSDVYREMCNFCEQNRLLARSQYENYALHDDRRHPNLCKSCFYKSICACCREEICIRCNRPTKISNSPVKAKVESVGKQSPRRRKPSPRTRRMNLSLLEENYDDSSDDGDGLNYSERPSSRMSSPKKYQSVAKPYSFNISESSMFHPMNTSTGTHDATQKGIAKGSHDDLKRMTDEKLSRYAKNYGDMRTRNAPLSKLIDIDPHPMPLMAQENTRSRSFNAYSASDSADSSVGNGFALKQMEARWQVSLPWSIQLTISSQMTNVDSFRFHLFERIQPSLTRRMSEFAFSRNLVPLRNSCKWENINPTDQSDGDCSQI